MFSIIDFITTAIALLFVLVTHEVAHGMVALWNGDDTAKNYGRLTLNPVKHLDLYGTLFLLAFKFGWAKPVPINTNKFKNKSLGLFTVSIAGIVVNIFTAFIFMLGYYYFSVKGQDFPVSIHLFIEKIIMFGISFAVFNLIPIPPLDGSRIIASILPSKYQNFMFKYEKYSFILLMLFFSLTRYTFLSDIISKVYIAMSNIIIKLIL